MTVEQSPNPAATLREITTAGNQILDRLELLLKPETDNRRWRRCWAEAKDYLGRIGDTQSADLMEAASAALWDLLLEQQMKARRQTGR